MAKQGDCIDQMVGASVGEPATKTKTIKEGSLRLNRGPKNRTEAALHIYYYDLLNSLLHSLQEVLHSSEKIPKIAKPIPIALAGGTVLPSGFREHFEKALTNVNLPIEISEVRIAEDPLNSTAKGAMVMALSEEV